MNRLRDNAVLTSRANEAAIKNRNRFRGLVENFVGPARPGSKLEGETLKNQKGYTAIELVIVLFICLILIPGGIGWVKNLVKLTRCDFEAPYKAEVIHTVGLVPPVGAITGWMNFGK